MYPDVQDRSFGIPVNHTQSGPYQRLDDDGNPIQNFLLPLYPEVGDIEVINADRIERQHGKRVKRDKLIAAKRLRNQPILPLSA